MKLLRLLLIIVSIAAAGGVAAAQSTAPENPNYRDFRLKVDGDISTPPVTGTGRVFWNGTSIRVRKSDGSYVDVGAGGGGSGTVTSVSITTPSFLTVGGSPVTTSGTLALALASQTANTIFAGPTTGIPDAPAFRALVAADLPSHSAALLTSGTVATARLGTGTANSTTFLRGDQTYAVPPGGGTITGADTRVLFFDGTDTPAGDAGFVFNKTTDAITLAGPALVGRLDFNASSGLSTPDLSIWATGGLGMGLVGNAAGVTFYSSGAATSWTVNDFFRPGSDNAQDIGDSTHRVNDVHVVNLKVYGATSGVTTVAAPTAAGTYTFVLPPNDGNPGDVVTNVAGDGVLTFAAPAVAPTRRGTAEVFEEFMGTLSGTLGPLVSNTAGAGAVLSYNTANPGGHPGIGRLATGSTSSGSAAFTTNVLTLIRFGSGIETFEAAVRLNQLSVAADTFYIRVGFLDSQTGSPVDSAGFRYTDTVNGGEWEGVSRANSVETGSVLDTNVAAVSGTWVRFTVVVNAAANLATYYINGVSAGTTNANIPTGAGRETGFGVTLVKTGGTTGTTSVTADVDYIDWTEVFTTPR